MSMPWWGVVLVAVGMWGVGYVMAALLSNARWYDILQERGRQYGKELEALAAKAAKYRDAYTRASARAAGYRSELEKYQGGAIRECRGAPAVEKFFREEMD